jgi:hypothetical protein
VKGGQEKTFRNRDNPDSKSVKNPVKFLDVVQMRFVPQILLGDDHDPSVLPRIRRKNVFCRSKSRNILETDSYFP